MYSIEAVKKEVFFFIIKWVIAIEKHFWNIEVVLTDNIASILRSLLKNISLSFA